MDRDGFLALDDAGLLAQCEVHRHRASGPGGQHRNKVSSAVRLRHRPTGRTASAAESRSQHENRRRALRRLRTAIACSVRQPIDTEQLQVPHVVAECLIAVRGRADSQAPRRLRVGRKDARFWAVSAFLLDLLEASAGRVAQAAALAGISTGNLVAVLRSDRHVLAAADALRKQHGHPPLR